MGLQESSTSSKSLVNGMLGVGIDHSAVVDGALPLTHHGVLLIQVVMMAVLAYFGRWYCAVTLENSHGSWQLQEMSMKMEARI